MYVCMYLINPADPNHQGPNTRSRRAASKVENTTAGADRLFKWMETKQHADYNVQALSRSLSSRFSITINQRTGLSVFHIDYVL